MNRIASFSVNHDYITPGIYLSRVDGDIKTYDLRTRTPNAGDYMDNLTMHSVEHLFATYIRNSEIGDRVIYFGPMGCQTGFYLLLRDVPMESVLGYVKDTLKNIIAHEGEMFGAKREECGNYRCLSVDAAKLECRRYLAALDSRDWDFTYPDHI
ncbi:MAG: S-ribosylhomocysteine lyase [Eubacteriales bacterium]